MQQNIMPGMGENTEAQHLFEQMQAKMQMLNNAANFARQTVFARIAEDAKESGTATRDKLHEGDSYMWLFNTALDFGMRMELSIEKRAGEIAREFENNPAIHVPQQQIIRPH